MGLRPLEIFFTLTVRGSTLEYDIYRRQILTTNVDSRAVRANAYEAICNAQFCY